MVKNFTQLEKSFRTLGIKFNVEIALQIKDKKPNVAVNLLRSLKDVLEKTYAQVDVQIV